MKLIIGKYEGTIYPEDNGYTGTIDLGTDGKGGRNRLKRKGPNQGDRQGQTQEGRQRARSWHRHQRQLHG